MALAANTLIQNIYSLAEIAMDTTYAMVLAAYLIQLVTVTIVTQMCIIAEAKSHAMALVLFKILQVI